MHGIRAPLQALDERGHLLRRERFAGDRDAMARKRRPNSLANVALLWILA